jgi:hypothetical protein
VFLSPPTYFIPPEQLLEYQRRIVDAFAPSKSPATAEAGC